MSPNEELKDRPAVVPENMAPTCNLVHGTKSIHRDYRSDMLNHLHCQQVVKYLSWRHMSHLFPMD